ncbi:hypothetical protein ACO34A_09840 [Rhizobium sp. ACO-34A]|nr:hypothetical protein [Rhizobium sp. ACO-34A]ATN34106.1 hypothetical protein ACO34A_09840 [Rhizobium sp. ACO-34A]
MALPTFYNAGVASVTAGGTVVTGDATYWQSVLEPGDLFTDGSGLLVRIASVDSETQLTLAYGWPGDAIVSGPYEVQLVPRSVGVQERTRQLLLALGNGNLSALSSLTGTANAIPYFTGWGTMALADGENLLDLSALESVANLLALAGVTAAAGKLPYFSAANAMSLMDSKNITALAGLVSAANQLPYFTGDGAAAITALTTFARTLLDDSDAATMRSTLGLPWEPIGSEVNMAGLSVASFSLPTGYTSFHLEFNDVNTSDAITVCVRTSTDDGASYNTGSSDYRYVCNQSSSAGTSTAGYSAGIAQILLTGTMIAAGGRGVGSFLIDPGSASIHPSFLGQSGVVVPNGTDMVFNFLSRRNTTGRINRFAVFCPSGTYLSGKFRLFGRR